MAAASVCRCAVLCFLASLSLRTASAFRPVGVGGSSMRKASMAARPAMTVGAEVTVAGGEASSTSDEDRVLLSVPERARTVTHAGKSGTLCTLSSEGGDLQGVPFGSYVDYVLDDQGHPVLLLSEQSMHTRNLLADGRVSMLVQLTSGKKGIPNAALPRCTIAGRIAEVSDQEDVLQARVSYSLAHEYAVPIVESPKFKFYKIVPESVYYVGGFGVLSDWVPVKDYEEAQPDILASRAAELVDKVNEQYEEELPTVCAQFLGIDGALDSVRVTTIDRLGMDLRVRSQGITNEFRLGFRMPATSLEDAQSELTKLFQEAWEKANGYAFEETAPPVKKIAEDGLREG